MNISNVSDEVITKLYLTIDGYKGDCPVRLQTLMEVRYDMRAEHITDLIAEMKSLEVETNSEIRRLEIDPRDIFVMVYVRIDGEFYKVAEE